MFTGGGVTAGIDLALTVMAEVAGEDHARAVQLAVEYAPQPPFDTGRPEQAPPRILATAHSRIVAVRAARDAAIAAAAVRLRLRGAN